MVKAVHDSSDPTTPLKPEYILNTEKVSQAFRGTTRHTTRERRANVKRGKGGERSKRGKQDQQSQVTKRGCCKDWTYTTKVGISRASHPPYRVPPTLHGDNGQALHPSWGTHFFVEVRVGVGVPERCASP